MLGRRDAWKRMFHETRRSVDTAGIGMDKQNTLPCRDERLLTDLEACEFLRIRQRQLYSWRMQGVIPFIRIGRSVRYRQRDLDATLDRMTIGGNQPMAH